MISYLHWCSQKFAALKWTSQEKAEMPEASNSNIHGHIHGRLLFVLINTGGVEEN